MARKRKFKVGDKVKSVQWPDSQFEIVMELDGRFAIANNRLRAIAQSKELTLIQE